MCGKTTRDTPRPICAVVDTNIWRSEPLLKTPMGVTLVYTVCRRGGVVGLPEVIERELEGQIVEAGFEAINKARGHLHTLSTLLDNPCLAILPSTDEVRKKYQEQITKLGPLLVREPFTLEHAKAALAMVNAKVAPSDKDQQFKDCAIWQAILALSLRYSTVLLTKDKAFFCDRDPKKGLANNLLADCAKAGGDVKAFCGIGPYLEALKTDEPTFDRNTVQQLVTPLAIQRLEIEAKRHRTVLTDLLDFTASAFKTEDPDRLAIDYSVTFKLDYNAPEDKEVLGVPNKGIAHGSAYFFPKANNLTEHYVQGIVLKGRSGRLVRTFKDYDGVFVVPRPVSWYE
jgi:hypothetical protein